MHCVLLEYVKKLVFLQAHKLAVFVYHLRLILFYLAINFENLCILVPCPHANVKSLTLCVSLWHLRTEWWIGDKSRHNTNHTGQSLLGFKWSRWQCPRFLWICRKSFGKKQTLLVIPWIQLLDSHNFLLGWRSKSLCIIRQRMLWLILTSTNCGLAEQLRLWVIVSHTQYTFLHVPVVLAGPPACVGFQ